MTPPPLPILVGCGVIVATLGGIGGFAIATRTRLSAPWLALLIGGTTMGAAAAVVISPTVRTGVILLAYVTLVGFPLYALFWTLYDFTERVVRS